MLGRLLGRAARIPTISTFHAGEPGHGLVRLYTAADRLTARLCGRAIAVSAPIARQIGGNAAVIPNFVRVCAPASQIVKAGSRTGRVAFVGRLSHEKGPDRFVSLAGRLPEVAFVVYGDGPMRSRLEAEAAGRVRFHGMVPSMADHWSDIGLLCVTSRHEGLPLVVLEAMAHGVPVAAFDVGAIGEAVIAGETGWLVAPGDLDGMAEAVRAWRDADEDTQTKLAERCRATIRQTYSVKACLPAIVEVYREALGEG